MIWKMLRRGTGKPAEDHTGTFIQRRDRGTQILLSAAQPTEFTKLEHRIRDELSLHQRWQSDRDTSRLLRQEIAAVEAIPGLAEVFMFHGDGRVRQAAMQHIDGPLMAPACVHALFQRLNDWVPEVRDTAMRAAERCLPATQADVIAPALAALLPHVASWGRWSQSGPEAVDALLMRQDVADRMLRDIVETRQSGLGLLFREICRNPWVDQHLERVFRDARLPHIRAMALDALISGKMRWPTRGVRKVWIDRSMGVFRLEQAYLDRDLTARVDIAECLHRAAQDRASMVRKQVADALIALRNTDVAGDRMEEIAGLLTHDTNPGVRGRMDFLHRKQSEDDDQRSDV